MVTSMRMSIIFREYHYYNETLTMDIVPWRRIGSRFVQRQKAQHTAMLNITSFVSNISTEYTVGETREKVYYVFYHVERSVTVVRSPINVTAGDIMGVSLPSNSSYINTFYGLTASVINGIHVSLQDYNRSDILREVGDCQDQTTGVYCYTVYPDVRPLIEVEFVPGWFNTVFPCVSVCVYVCIHICMPWMYCCVYICVLISCVFVRNTEHYAVHL